MDDFEQDGGWRTVYDRLFSREDLSSEQAGAAFDQIFLGAASPAQIAAFISALRVKGETVEEMSGFVSTMLDRAEPLDLDGDLVDTCGTGGDGSRSINVSTIAALVVAGAGARVCKHGGRAASSQAGSADVLEALGVAIDLGPDGVRRCVDEVGIGFCFAPRFHPAMRYAAPVRRELGVPTIFNFLGPLANPARARFQVVGVSDPVMAPKMVGVLAANHSARDVYDLGPDGNVTRFVVDPEELGIPRATLEDLRGGDAATNATAVRKVLTGEKGPHRDIALLNAAAGLVVCGRAIDLRSGVDLAAEVIDEGRADAILAELVRVSVEASRS